MRAGVGIDDVEPWPGLRVGVQVAAKHRQPAMDRMDVRVLEAGGHGPPVKLDHAGPRPDQVADRGVVSDGDDALTSHGERRRPRACRIHRRDAATAEDEVGWSVGRHGRAVSQR